MTSLPFQFKGRKDKWPHSLGIIPYDFLIHIIFIAAIPVRIASQSRSPTYPGKARQTVLVIQDKFLQHGFKGSFSYFQVPTGQVPVLRPFGKCIGATPTTFFLLVSFQLLTQSYGALATVLNFSNASIKYDLLPAFRIYHALLYSFYVLFSFLCV